MNHLEKTTLSLLLGLSLLSLASCQAKTHVVTWLNDDGTVIGKEEVPNGDTPIFRGETPSKPSTSQYEYTFAGWSEDLSPVYSDITYTATYSQAVRQYKISWLNEGGSLLKTTKVPYGEMPQYGGDLPAKIDTKSESYSFSTWSPALQEVTGDAIYTAVFKAATKQFCVTWKNEDGSILKTSLLEYGSKPVYDGQTPTKPSDSNKDYSFSSWRPQITDDTIVTSDRTYTAVFSSSVKTATIKWVNEDGTLLKEDSDVPYGTYPSFGSSNPTKAGDANHTYEFMGWDPALHSVMGNITYRAVFKEEAKKYQVRWLNYDGSLLCENEVSYGARPVYEGATPYRPSDAEYSYTFAGWDKGFSPICEDVVYQAQFNKETRKYTVQWVDYNGVILERDEGVAYGTMPTYNGGTPSRKSDSLYTYTFSGWEPALEPVKEDITYRAVYTKQESTKKFTVTWRNDNGQVLKEDHLTYGSIPSYEGEEPTKEGNAQYSYSFEGWDKPIAPVTGDTIYVAKYKETVRQYTIQWLDSDGSLIQEEQIEYGKMPTCSETPTTKEDSYYRYTFESWSPNVTAVQGDQKYVAQYRKDALYTIRFVNYNGDILYIQKAIYGETPTYPKAAPTRPSSSSSSFDYEFSGWTPSISPVKKDQAYQATYREVPKKFTVRWQDYNGKLLASEIYTYNQKPSFKGEKPSRSSDEQYEYTFTDWSPSLVNVREDATYTAHYSKKLMKALVSFDLQGGKTNSSTRERYSSLADGKDLFYDLAKTGYVFLGWSYNGIRLFDQKGEKLVQEIELSEKMTLKADFGVPHTLTLQNDSGAGGTLSGSGSYACGEKVKVKAEPRQGYKFNGWKLDGVTISSKEEYSFTMPDQDYLLTASFSLKEYRLSIVVSSDYGNFTVKVNGIEERYSSELYVKYTYRVTVAAVSNSSSIVFDGWFDSDGKKLCDTAVYSFYMPYNDLKIIAKWHS